MIDAEIKSEEKYIKLAIAYDKEEKEKVCFEVENIIKRKQETSDVHMIKIKDGREVIVVEYCSSIDRREVGKIFEEILCQLNIKKCIN